MSEEQNWDGVTDRRQTYDHRAHPAPVDLEAIWKLLRELEMSVKLHMEEEKELKPKLLELLSLLERSKGVFSFLRIVLWVGGPLVAFGYWVKDHIKW